MIKLDAKFTRPIVLTTTGSSSYSVTIGKYNGPALSQRLVSEAGANLNTATTANGSTNYSTSSAASGSFDLSRSPVGSSELAFNLAFSGEANRISRDLKVECFSY